MLYQEQASRTTNDKFIEIKETKRRCDRRHSIKQKIIYSIFLFHFILSSFLRLFFFTFEFWFDSLHVRFHVNMYSLNANLHTAKRDEWQKKNSVYNHLQDFFVNVFETFFSFSFVCFIFVSYVCLLHPLPHAKCQRSLLLLMNNAFCSFSNRSCDTSADIHTTGNANAFMIKKI